MRSIVLGGAQFSTQYGKLVKVENLSHGTVESILERALEAGIKEIDLAENYIGAKNKLSLIKSIHKFNVSTKIEYSEVKSNELVNSLIKSLRQLRKSNFHTVYIHNWMNLSLKNKMKSLEFLNRLRKEEISQYIGISIYDLNELEGIDLKLDYIQAPLNYFNRDFLYSRIVSDCIESGTIFSARSIFHQGTLLTQDSNLLVKYPAIQDFNSYCKSRGLSRLEGALSVYDSQKVFTKLIVGVDSEEKLLEIVNCQENSFNQIPSFERESFNKDFFDPRKW